MSVSYRREHDAFRRFIQGKPIPLGDLVVLFFKSLLGLFEMAIRYIPGGIGFKLRYYYYKLHFKEMGKNVLIDTGVILNGTRNISLADYVWVDTNCRIDAILGEVSIGRRVHVAPNALIFAREPVTIGDYVGIGGFSRIYSSTEVPKDGKHACGPMVPEELRCVRYEPINIGSYCLVGTGAVILPGSELGEGAVVGANSVLSKPVEPWTIVGGIPAKPIAKRDPVPPTTI